MKPNALRIEHMLEKIEAKLVPPERKCLCAIIHEGDDAAEAKEKALAEHVARHPEDVGRTVEDFNWDTVGGPQMAKRSRRSTPFLTADNQMTRGMIAILVVRHLRDSI